MLECVDVMWCVARRGVMRVWHMRAAGCENVRQALATVGWYGAMGRQCCLWVQLLHQSVQAIMMFVASWHSPQQLALPRSARQPGVLSCPCSTR